jgi:hypothetical protein
LICTFSLGATIGVEVEYKFASVCIGSNGAAVCGHDLRNNRKSKAGAVGACMIGAHATACELSQSLFS